MRRRSVARGACRGVLLLASAAAAVTPARLAHAATILGGLPSEDGAQDAPAAPTAPTAPTATDEAPSSGEDAVLARVFREGGSKFAVTQTPDVYRLQVLFTEITDGALVRHAFRVDTEYFYPASAVKLPLAVAALAREGTTEDGGGGALPAPLVDDVRRALIGSDNDAAARLLGTMGNRAANERLWSFGVASARVRQRSPVPRDDDGSFEIPVDDMPGMVVGDARSEGGKLIPEGMSFQDKNRVSLQDLQDLLVKVVRPDLGGTLEGVSPEARTVLEDALRTLPSESKSPSFDPAQYPDLAQKPFLAGAMRVLPRERLHVYGKGGRALGFSVENSYVVDRKTGRGYFLTAAVYTNEDGVMNDDVYNYGVATAFLVDLSEALTRRVLK